MIVYLWSSTYDQDTFSRAVFNHLMIAYLWSRHLMIKTIFQLSYACLQVNTSICRARYLMIKTSYDQDILWSRHLMMKTSLDQDFSWSRHPMSKTWRIILWRIASYPQRGKGGKNWQFSFWNFFQLNEEEPSIFSDICEADFLFNIHPSELLSDLASTGLLDSLSLATPSFRFLQVSTLSSFSWCLPSLFPTQTPSSSITTRSRLPIMWSSCGSLSAGWPTERTLSNSSSKASTATSCSPLRRATSGRERNVALPVWTRIQAAETGLPV